MSEISSPSRRRMPNAPLPCGGESGHSCPWRQAKAHWNASGWLHKMVNTEKLVPCGMCKNTGYIRYTPKTQPRDGNYTFKAQDPQSKLHKGHELFNKTLYVTLSDAKDAGDKVHFAADRKLPVNAEFQMVDMSGKNSGEWVSPGNIELRRTSSLTLRRISRELHFNMYKINDNIGYYQLFIPDPQNKTVYPFRINEPDFEIGVPQTWKWGNEYGYKLECTVTVSAK